MIEPKAHIAFHTSDKHDYRKQSDVRFGPTLSWGSLACSKKGNHLTGRELSLSRLSRNLKMLSKRRASGCLSRRQNNTLIDLCRGMKCVNQIRLLALGRHQARPSPRFWIRAPNEP